VNSRRRRDRRSLKAKRPPIPLTVAAQQHEVPAAPFGWSAGSGLSLLKSGPGSNETVVHANGLGQSALPYGGLHTVLGALPAMVHPAPVSVAIIGLGSGDTLFGVGGRSETQRIDSIEIIVPELETLQQLDRRRHYPALRMLLQDPRVQHWFTDGRTLIRKASRRYDIIEADALRPTGAYAGHLYSVEYFELLRDRVNPGGLAVTWAPTERVVDTFVKVFPHVLEFGHMAIGSTMPLSFNREVILDRVRLPFTRDYYRRGAVDIETLLAPYLVREPRVFGPEIDRGTLLDVNRDLFPKDEFAVAYRGPRQLPR